MSVAHLADTGLPFNRKERFFTGTVLPMLVCADDFAHFGRLIGLVGLSRIEVDARPGSACARPGFALEHVSRIRLTLWRLTSEGVCSSYPQFAPRLKQQFQSVASRRPLVGLDDRHPRVAS